MDTALNFIIGLGVVAIIALVVYFVLKKRNPQAAQEMAHVAGTSASVVHAALGRAFDTIDNLTEKLHQSAPVAPRAVAVPAAPVQAPAQAPAQAPQPTEGVPAPAAFVSTTDEENAMACSQEQRELVCRSIAFGPVDPYTKKLESAEYKPQLIGGTVANTKNAYAPGGQCNAGDGGYYNAHTNPMAFGWKWVNGTYVEPPGGDPMGMKWNGKNFV